MGNTQASKQGQTEASQAPGKKLRPMSIAVDKLEPWRNHHSHDPPPLRRSPSQNSFRRRFSGSGSYTYKTPWPLPWSEAAFLPEYDSKPPVKFSDFEILANVGKGAFGHVLQVKKKDSNEVFAMKVLNKSEIIRQEAVQQCKDEVTIQEHVGSFPFLVRTSYTWQTKHNLFIVSDFVDGSDLYTLWLQERTLEETLVRLYVAELALTLDFLHKGGIIFRDLKMENVLLDDQGHVKLVDFGLSKCLKPRERTQTICGTLQYMAPEVLRGQKYTHSVDWWSLGILMYTLLVGKYPYPVSKEHGSQLELVSETRFDLSCHLSVDSANVLKKLLQKHPANRLSDMESLKSQPFFKELCFDEVLQKKASPLSADTLKKLRRRSTSRRIFFPRKVESVRADARKGKRSRPLSWASPGNFAVHDRNEMDWLVADLGSLSALQFKDNNRNEAKELVATTTPLSSLE